MGFQSAAPLYKLALPRPNTLGLPKVLMTQDPSSPRVNMTTDRNHANAAPMSRPADWMFLQPAILDQMHDSVIVTDLAGIVTGCNRAAFEMFGYTPEELIGRSVSILYPSEEAKYLANIVVPAIHEKGEFRGEVRTRTRSGDYLYVHLCSSLLRDTDGNPAGMVGFSIDVTAQKLGELALRHQEDAALNVSREVNNRTLVEEELRLTNERFKTALRNSPVVVFNQDLDLRYTWIYNPALGYQPSDVIGKRDIDIFEREQDAAVTEAMKLDVIRTGQSRRQEVVVHWRGVDGFYDLLVDPLLSTEGNIVGVTCAAIDITQRKSTEQKLRASESRFRKLFESDLMGIGVPDRFGAFSEANDELLRIVGFTRADLEAGLVRWDRMTPPEYQALDIAHIAEAAERGSCTPYEKEYIRKDGSRVPILCGYALLEGSGDQYIGFVQDLTPQKRTEEALLRAEKLAAVGRLANSISHEINNPLESVTNLLYLLGYNPSLDQAAREYLATAEEQLARVSQVATQALRFHRQSTSATPVNVSELVDSVLTIHRPILQSKEIEVQRQYRDAPKLRCYSSEIRQALASLISNSLDAMNPGGILRVRVNRQSSDTVGPGIRISLADSGHGIAASNLPRIFEPFFSTKEINATGLGLWITRGIVERHCGNISIRSSVRPGNSGTVFAIFLPYEH